ncbi:hypothetical protein [Ignatzschineria cameli]|uniref:DUF1834 domain-containing protein n=1 Tax=Ignatzschineria cameli TaxID=2182793 RepID=A0ABX5L1S8_9GAMM|nr:hypothetical protein [Ignatzschineria cameli]PWD90344.1 hypothetical protein DC079_04175 [Ignatzschineria cameli]PWD92227.1 hypothetical protein DC081_03880 [Ignatzschineria cameli]PWD93021.1 hypothetical protein DC078_04175 [Ignatzschineria cameli]
MQDSSISIMQKALVEWLDTEFKHVVRKVQAFDGLWTDSDVRTHIQATPSLFVTWLGNRAGVHHEKTNTWSILLFMRVNNAKQTDRERELATAIIEYIEQKLHRRKLSNKNGTIGGELKHIKSENLWHNIPKGYGFTLYGITFEQDMYPVGNDDSSLDDFLTYYEKVGGDPVLIETIAKPNEPL